VQANPQQILMLWSQDYHLRRTATSCVDWPGSSAPSKLEVILAATGTGLECNTLKIYELTVSRRCGRRNHLSWTTLDLPRVHNRDVSWHTLSLLSVHLGLYLIRRQIAT
jgi:hypothetical protein